MKVLSDIGVQSIDILQLPATLEYLFDLTCIDRRHLVTLGSAGKVLRSGDIDVAVDIKKYYPEGVHSNMVEALGEDHCYYNPGLRIGSYAVPIEGDASKGLVQVDLMYVRNVEWAQFAYFSAGIDSWYKGAVRAILLSAIAGSINEPGKDAFVYDEEGELLVRAGWGLDLNVGLKRMYQMRGISKRDGTWLKTMKNVTPNEILDKFPILEFDQGDWKIDDPEEVVHILFDKDTNVSDIETAEDILWLMYETDMFSQERVDNIIKIAKKRAQPLAEKMELPFELK